MTINREGYGIIFWTALAVAVVDIVAGLLLPSLFFWIIFIAAKIFFIFIVAFFREPSRPFVQNDELVYAPADGVVVVCEEVFEKEFVEQKRVQLSVFMSPANVHVNWYPVGGVVKYFKYHEGKYMVAWHPKSSEDNERTTTVVNTGKHDILFRQVAGAVARRIVSYPVVGETVQQNTKFGFIKFGSRIDVMLPVGTEILVHIGDKVVGSQTPLARLK